MVKQRPRLSAPGTRVARIITHGNALETSGTQHLEDVVEEDHRLGRARRELWVADLDGGHAARVRNGFGVELFRQQLVRFLQVGGRAGSLYMVMPSKPAVPSTWKSS